MYLYNLFIIHFRRDAEDAEVEMWYRQGARPKLRPGDPATRRAASAVDLREPRDRESPINRVRFQDEVYSESAYDNEALQPHHRTVSYPELLHGSNKNHGASDLKFGSKSNPPHINMNGNVTLSRPRSALSHSSSDLDLHGPGRPQNGSKLARNVKQKQNAVPLDTILSHASTSDRDFESSLELHRANPAVVLPDGSIAYDSLSHSNFSGPELAHEIGYYSKIREDINAVDKIKKSKKPWKRNKAKFTPGDFDEKLHSNLVKARSASSIAQSTESLHSNSSRPSVGSAGNPSRLPSGNVSRPPSGRPQHQTSRQSSVMSDASLDNTYEVVVPDSARSTQSVPLSARSTDSVPVSARSTENPYEEVVHYKKRTPPPKPPRPFKKKAQTQPQNSNNGR